MRAKLPGTSSPPPLYRRHPHSTSPHLWQPLHPLWNSYLPVLSSHVQKEQDPAADSHYPHAPKHQLQYSWFGVLDGMYNCSSRNLYVGQTARTLWERMSGHRAAHSSNKNMPLYRHLSHHPQPRPLSGVRVTIIEVITNATEASLLAAEAKWISLLNTRLPHGLNSQFS